MELPERSTRQKLYKLFGSQGEVEKKSLSDLTHLSSKFLWA